MSRPLVAQFSAIALFLAGCWIGYTQAQTKAPPELTLNKVTNNLYEIEGDGGNATFLPVTEIICTANARANILDNKQANAPPRACSLPVSRSPIKRPCSWAARKCARITSAAAAPTAPSGFL
jgi:hypothetical protein